MICPLALILVSVEEIDQSHQIPYDFEVHGVKTPRLRVRHITLFHLTHILHRLHPADHQIPITLVLQRSSNAKAILKLQRKFLPINFRALSNATTFRPVTLYTSD